MRQEIHLIVWLCLLAGCTRSPQEQYTKYLNEGKDAFIKKNFPKATVLFRNAAKSLPKEAEPHYQLGITASALGDNTSAAQWLKQAVDLNPKHLDAALFLSDLYTRSAHKPTLEEGKRLAQSVLTVDPENLKAANILAVVELRSGDYKAAAVRLEHSLKRNPNDVETVINLARLRMAQNDRHGAEELLRNATLSSQSNAKTVFALADFYNMIGDQTKAVESYSRGLQIEPDHAPALATLGRIHARAGKQKDADDLFARAAKNPDRRFRYLHASYLFDSGRRDAAIEEFAKLYRQDASDREARTSLIKAYLATGRTREAEDLLAQAISRNAKDADALLQRARVFVSRGKPDAAQSDLRLVLEYLPDSAEAHYLTAEVHRLQRKPELQQQELAEALRLDPHYQMARLELSRLLISKDPRGALSIIDSAPAEQREDPTLRVQRIWPLLELNRTEEARTAISELITSGSPEVLLQDAILRMRQRDFAAARASAQKALDGNPADVRALDLIMRCFVGEKRPAEGVAAIRRHATQHQKIPEIQLFLARVEMLSGNASQARIALEAAKAADTSMDAEWGLIDLDLSERKFDDARRRIAPLLKGSASVVAISKLALIEQATGNYQAASEHYQKVLQSDPRSLMALNNLAYIFAEYLNKPTDALRYAQSAKELAPEDAGVDDTLGWTYYRMGLYPGAVRHLELAVKRLPTARRHAHLAMAYAKNGDKARAKQMLEVSLKMDPKLPETSLAQKIVLE